MANLDKAARAIYCAIENQNEAKWQVMSNSDKQKYIRAAVAASKHL